VFFGLGIVFGEERAIEKQVQISPFSSESSTHTKISEEERKSLEIMEHEFQEREKQIRERLPKIIEEVRRWIKEDKFPPYQDYVFDNLAKVDNDPRVFELYCEVIENASDIRAKLYAIAGIRRSNNRNAIPILKKALSDKSIFVRCEAANLLFDWSEKDSVYFTYIEILNNKDLENQLDKEVPEKLKHIGFFGDKLDPQWQFYSTKLKADILISVLQRVLTYDKSSIKKIIKKIVKDQKIIFIVNESIKLESKLLEEHKKKYPNWTGFKTYENYIKSKIDLIKNLEKLATE